MKIIIEGEPIPQKRHRHAGKRTYDPSAPDKKKVEKVISLNKPSSYSQISVHFHFFCKMPKSWSKKKVLKMEGKVRPKLPDIDNYIKFYLDCMNGIIFPDDNIVVEVYAIKVYSQKPCTVITIKDYE